MLSLLAVAGIALTSCGTDAPTEESAPAEPSAVTIPEITERPMTEPVVDERQQWANEMVNLWLLGRGAPDFDFFLEAEPDSPAGHIISYESPEPGKVVFTVAPGDWTETSGYYLATDFMGSVGWDNPGEFETTTVQVIDGSGSWTFTCLESPGCRQ